MHTVTKQKKYTKHTAFHYLATVLLILLKSFLGASIWIVIGGGGYLIFQTKRSPYDLVFGLPLMLIGAGLIINSLSSVFYALFSPKYNKALCPFCSPS